MPLPPLPALGVALALLAGAPPARHRPDAPPAPRPRPVGTHDTLTLPGLRAPVTLLRDSAGVVHIRARNEHDLFMAQGWSVARDRLFQLEHWRRLATGTMSEIVGARGVPIDESLRLLRYRGDLDADLAWYHPRGRAIVRAFVEGINAYVGAANRDTTLLPPEFALLGIRPGRWTPAVVVSRHNGLFDNVEREIATVREVLRHGDSTLRARRGYGPGDPLLRGDSAVDYAAIPATVLARFRAHQRLPAFVAADLRPPFRRDDGRVALAAIDALLARPCTGTACDEPREGSNNWAVAGRRSASGKPLVANDPHRAITVPSLRYLVHLDAPGWQVIGGGEPALPGVAIGRNAVGAWGLTIFSMDMEDLVVLRLAPGRPDAYVDATGAARAMRLERDTIRVKGSTPVVVTHRFAGAWPVLHVDTARALAYALRAAWLERGTAPYLASLRLDQARSWREFRASLSYARAPALNWVWGDTRGTIGWQVAGIAPLRRGFSGMVPVSARFAWDGFLPVAALPHVVDPRTGSVHSANEMNVPAGYAHPGAITPGGWAEPWRARRIAQVLDSTPRLTLDDMARLQHDDLSLSASHVRRLLRDDACRPRVMADAPQAALVDETLRAWDGRMRADAVAPLLHRGFERALRADVGDPSPSLERLPATWRGHVADGDACGRQLARALAAAARSAARDTTTVSSQVQAPLPADSLFRRYGDWHRTRIEHPLGRVVTDSIRRTLEPSARPRGGDGNTVFATGSDEFQRGGASLRVLFDLAHPDSSRFTNTPGQSGDPRSPWYQNLHDPWVRGAYAPLPMTRRAVDRATAAVTELRPRASGRGGTNGPR
ncbi:MAG: penicillin acylase family protein [Gemmatimonadaceae bacterium]|nr:penicillin acylase family protein [Gemmatimonadaceae bacterium]